MGCSFQNWRSISCSLRGSMLCMVLYLDFHCVSHQQLFEAVGARQLAHHSHLRRHHRRLLRFLGLGLGYRGGNSSNRAFGLGRSGGGCGRGFGLGFVLGTRRSAAALGSRRGGLWLWLGSWRGGRGRNRRRSWRSRSNIVRRRRGSSHLLCLDRLFRRFPPSIYCPAPVRPARQPSRYMQKLTLVPRKFTRLPS